MRKKRVWRYYCDFCKKAGCSAYHLRNHEERCTMNPNRTCGMCKLLDQSQPALANLVALMPATVVKQEGDCADWIGWESNPEAQAALANLRKAAGNCPACILAALRQAKIPVPMMTGFDYAAESKLLRDDFYEAQSADRYEYA